MASTYLTKTQVAPTNAYKGTFSAWIKITEVPGGSGTDRWIFGEYGDSNNHAYIYLRNSSQLGWYETDGSGAECSKITTRLLRDTNAWMHIVYAWDTTLATAEDRLKLYINGVRETSFATNDNYSQNYAIRINKVSKTTYIGGVNGYQTMFDGLMTHVHYCDGSQLDASVFGNTDSVTGEWNINTSPSFTLGNNGFTILQDNNTVTDQSSNSNNFTVAGGTLTSTKDNPSNVFAVLNLLNVPVSNQPTFSNGNTTSITNTGSGSYKWGGCTTLGMTSGKFYCEAKATVDSTYSRNVIGITGDSANIARANGSILNGTHSWGYYSSNGAVAGNGGGDLSGYNTTYTTGDIISMALDLDNNKLYFRKNNDAWQNSGDPTSGASGTGAVSIIAASATNDGAYFFAQTDDTGTTSPSKFDFNFGNGYFGTTAVSSAGTNASGNGIFEYDVPTGYTALSTKGLNL